MNLCEKLLTTGADRDLPRLDEKFYLEVFQQPPTKKGQRQEAMTRPIPGLDADELLHQFGDVPPIVMLDAALATVATGANPATMIPSFTSMPS